MSGLFEKYATDQKLETEGSPFVEHLYPDGRERTFYLARLDEDANPQYGNALRKARRKHSTQIRTDTMDDGLDRKLSMEIFVDTILKGWDHVEVDAPIQGKQGKLPFNRQNALWLLRTLPDLYAILRAAAADMKLFKDAQFMGEAKGSPATSPGNSSTVSPSSSASETA